MPSSGISASETHKGNVSSRLCDMTRRPRTAFITLLISETEAHAVHDPLQSDLFIDNLDIRFSTPACAIGVASSQCRRAIFPVEAEVS